jgi:hypothetical protein
MDGYDPDHVSEPGGSYELLAESTLGALLEPFSNCFGRCFLIEVRQEVPKLLRWELPYPL